MAEAATAATGNGKGGPGSNWDMLPEWSRTPLQAVVLAGTVAGALMSVFTLASFLARLLVVSNAWDWAKLMAESAPAFVLVTLNFIGSVFHVIVQAYRDTIYPYVDWVLERLALKLERWHIDVILVTMLSVTSASKTAIVDRRIASIARPRVKLLLKILTFPFDLVFLAGLWLVNQIDNVIFRVARLLRRPLKPFLWLYDTLPRPVDWLVIGTISNALVLFGLLGIDRIYVLWRDGFFTALMG